MHRQTTARYVPHSPSSRSRGLAVAEGLVEQVSGFQEKTTWFLRNIVTGRPNLKARVRDQSRPRRRLRKSRKHITPELEVKITKEESALHDDGLASVPTPNFGRVRPRRTLRSAGRIQRTNTGELVITHGKIPTVCDKEESDYEDFGEWQSCSMSSERFPSSSDPSYYFGPPHVPGLIESVAARLLPTVDEEPELAFDDTPEEASKSRQAVDGPPSVPIDCVAPSRSLPSPRAETPIIQITQATPTVLDSPVFEHRALITPAKYLQATSPQLNTSLRSGSSTGSLDSIFPVPSIPSCERCCLAQLEDSAICRTCQRQWLACKIWYQANDGGRRRWLTEPFIRPAESNADIRAVMESLRGPFFEDPVTLIGLGYESQTLDKKAPSFQVVDLSPATPGVHCGCATTCAGKGVFFSGSALWRHPHSTSTEETGRTQGTLRTWLAVSRAYLTSPSVRC